MSITKLTSREFSQDTSRAKKAAKRGPVIITDRGKPGTRPLIDPWSAHPR